MNENKESGTSNVEFSSTLIQINAAKSAIFKKIIDIITKCVFFGLAICSIGVVVLTLVYLIYSGLEPFFIPAPTDGNPSARLDFAKFISGMSYASPSFGIGWLIVNTIYVTILSMIIAIPIGVLTALFITRMSNKIIGSILNTVVNVLSGIPSVIIGVFGMGWITRFVDMFSHSFGDQVWNSSGRSILAAMIVLAIMCLPTICSMSVTAIRAVDKKLTMASLALGASKTQTNFKTILPAAQSGIFAGIILGIGRAIGEATAVAMVTGSTGGINFSIFDNTATLTTKMLIGINELSRTSLDYKARFSVGLVLMILIIVTNLGLNAVRNYIYRKNNGITSTPKKKKAK